MIAATITASTTSFTPAFENEALMRKYERNWEKIQHQATDYSDSRRIKGLPGSVYEKSLWIPHEGIREKLALSIPPRNVEDGWAWAFPVISVTHESLTDADRERLGTYSVKANVVKYVDRTGRTWVSPCPSVLAALHKAGFRKVDDPAVNFINGGQPTGIFNGKDSGHHWGILMELSRKEIRKIKAAEKAEANRICAQLQAAEAVVGDNTP